jgi:hypothetical protein
MTSFIDPRSAQQAWEAPESCTLPTAEQPLRVAEWDDLFAETLESVTRTDAQRVRLALAGPPELLGRVRDLADRETECCSFFEFTVSTPGGSTVLADIAVPANHVEVLAALADRAEAQLAHRGDR